ncbi:histidine kinase N-terminal 7TM domain-containing protein [Halopenitus salinus]|uniref:histidine kinase n=1 Tax=Halopenitus salinus TaxID=1198295 RepID=A0ABD5UV47_9EURY
MTTFHPIVSVLLDPIGIVPALFASIVIGAAAAILAWRQRPEPGAAPLVAMLAGQCWWSVCILFKLQAATTAEKTLWMQIGWIGVVSIPVAWVLFALEYTGRDRYLRPRYVLGLCLVPAITVVLALTIGHHDLMYVRPLGAGPNGVMQFEQGGAWYWVIAGYTYLLGMVGAVPLIRLLASDAGAFRGQSAALLVGLVVPWLTNGLFLAGMLPTSGLDPTPVAFSVSGFLYLNAITRFRLLGTSPAPNRRAREILFDRMQEGAVVVDRNDYVVDLNQGCIRMLGVDPREVLGEPASEIVPGYDRLPTEGMLDGHLTVGDAGGGHPYDVAVTEIHDVRDRTIGRVITFHDVGKHLRQQQRLEVLNRLLRHNIRTETNVIYGYADRFEDGEGAEMVKQRALRIEEIARKGREAIELFETKNGSGDSRSLSTLLERTVADVREAYPDVTVAFDPPGEDEPVDGMVEPVFANAIENAAEHNDHESPSVWVDAERADRHAVVRIADDGPGIDDYELDVLDRGTETALHHGSGMGLWIIKWGMEMVGGAVRFDDRDPVGTVVTLEIPLDSRSGE